MGKDIFYKEADALDQARAALERARGLDADADRAFGTLIERYARLVRQSERMATMGDRIQNSLNRLNQEIAASESRYRSVFENVTEGIYRCAPDGRLVEINPAMAAMFGHTDAESFLEDVGVIRGLFDRTDDYERYCSLLDSGGVRRLECRASGPNGNPLWVEVSASRIPGGDGEPDTVVGVLTDVTERKRMLEDMCRLARTDSLTGLWNRGYFMELADREVARSLRSESDLSLLILDVDYFKAVNDVHGHDAGDRALVGIAGALLGAVREVDIAARYGGEEFVAVLPDASRDEGVRIAERICRRIRDARLDCGGVSLGVTVSIGLTSLRPGDDLDGLLKFADIALYAAKKKGRDRTEVYRRDERSCAVAYAEGPEGGL